MLHGAMSLETCLAISVEAVTEILLDKLHEGCYTVQWPENAMRCGNHCEK